MKVCGASASANATGAASNDVSAREAIARILIRLLLERDTIGATNERKTCCLSDAQQTAIYDSGRLLRRATKCLASPLALPGTRTRNPDISRVPGGYWGRRLRAAP